MRVYVGNRIVGEVRGSTFHKDIKGSVHLLRTPPAMAFDVSIIEQAKRSGANSVCVKDTETGKEYKFTIKDLYDKGFHIDRVYGKQIGLPLDFFEKKKEKPVAQETLF